MTITAVVLAVVAAAAVAAAAWALTAMRAARTELDQLSHYDRLTGLPNRSVLHQALDELLRDARRTKARVTVISVQLRSFAALNETYGHEVGDELMMGVARRLRKAQRSGDRLVRYGGPQFVVMCPGIGDGPRALDRAQDFLAAIAPPFSIREDHIRIAANAGVVISDDRYASAEDLLLDAAMALHDAESAGPDEVALHDHSQRTRMSPSNAEHRLRQALDNGEFWLAYLPVVSLVDRRVVGVEALLRWSNPDRGLVNPEDFLKALDDTGLIVPVGEWVLREASRQNKDWQDRFPSLDLTTTVNMSARQLGQADFSDTVATIVAETGVEPRRLCLELTEGALARDLETAWMVLRQTKQIGIQLALDDFGTGFSSLGTLRRFSLDSIKIDRSFVAHITASAEDEAIVEHIVRLAHALGMVPIAEGVESGQQAERLAALGCDAAQGYHFSQPKPAEEIEVLFTSGTPEGAVAPAVQRAPAPQMAKTPDATPEPTSP